MSDDGVTRVRVWIDGQEMDDIKAVREQEYSPRRRVEYMAKTGTAELTPRRGIEIDYVVPGGGRPEYNWAAMKDKLIVVEKDGGGRQQFVDSSTLDVGQADFDGENECVKTITIGAADVRDE